MLFTLVLLSAKNAATMAKALIALAPKAKLQVRSIHRDISTHIEIACVNTSPEIYCILVMLSRPRGAGFEPPYLGWVADCSTNWVQCYKTFFRKLRIFIIS